MPKDFELRDWDRERARFEEWKYAAEIIQPDVNGDLFPRADPADAQQFAVLTRLRQQFEPTAISRPETLRIHEIVWPVRYVDGLLDGDGTPLHGKICYDRWCIYADSRNEQNVAQILMHEALHGILDIAGHEVEEDVIVWLGNALVQFLRDNPTLVEYIQRTGVLS